MCDVRSGDNYSLALRPGEDSRVNDVMSFRTLREAREHAAYVARIGGVVVGKIQNMNTGREHEIVARGSRKAGVSR